MYAIFHLKTMSSNLINHILFNGSWHQASDLQHPKGHNFAVALLAELLLMSIACTGCFTFRDADPKVERYFAKHSQTAYVRRIALEERPIRFVQTANAAQDSLPLIVFVHGAPGSIKDFQKYLTDTALLTRARMVSLDRPGYGYSGYGRAEPAIARQAAAVKAVLDCFQAKQTILVGHSYGGPVVGKCAMDYPDAVSAVLLLAPVIDPASEKIYWYAYFTKWKATRWLFSKAFRVAGAEKFEHPGELRQIAPHWRELRTPLVHLHGLRDRHLAPAKANLAFSEANVPTSLLQIMILEKADHFLPYRNYATVREVLFRLLSENATE